MYLNFILIMFLIHDGNFISSPTHHLKKLSYRSSDEAGMIMFHSLSYYSISLTLICTRQDGKVGNPHAVVRMFKL